MNKNIHIPVLIEKILPMIREKDAKIVDATLGLGGYIQNIGKLGIQRKYLGIDQDPGNLAMAKTNLETLDVRFENDNFRNMKEIVKKHHFADADIFLFDLGLCQTHLDDEKRGFSFKTEGPLDMRFSSEGMSAGDYVNTAGEKDLAETLKQYGEEPLFRDIARAIVEKRKKEKFKTTTDLSETVKNVYHAHGWKESRKNPATRTFQALRIRVNNELEVLQQGLRDTIELMKPGSRIFVVSYHSLEDRIAKNILRDAKKEGKLILKNKKVITPDENELQTNPKSRSAKLRIAEKI